MAIYQKLFPAAEGLRTVEFGAGFGVLSLRCSTESAPLSGRCFFCFLQKLPSDIWWFLKNGDPKTIGFNTKKV